MGSAGTMGSAEVLRLERDAGEAALSLPFTRGEGVLPGFLLVTM